jgi:GTP pyrophosphokinase
MKAEATTARLTDALAFTAEAFRHKHRKGSGVPYLIHLLYVTALVGEAGGDEDQIIAALLHDYLEDIPAGTEAELAARFGSRVARLVVALSDTVVHPKPPWRERKIKYLGHLVTESAEVKLISAADKLHNCTSIVRDHQVMGDAIFERFNPDKKGTLWYYRSVVAALANNWSHWLLAELRVSVEELHRVSAEPMPEGWDKQLDGFDPGDAI